MGEEALSSPKGDKVKFLCSHGGKILPRPSDGQLKYVGGDTRVVAVPRTITFSELQKKLMSLVDGEVVLKYQLMPEDLDALVTVRTDEDLKHMLAEYDRYEAKSSNNGGSPKLRAFLFSRTPFVVNETQSFTNTNDFSALEQRYIDAINGVLRTNNNVGQCSFSASSPGSSPRSNVPDTYIAEIMNPNTIQWDRISRPSRILGRGGMHKVHSSPSLLSLGQQQQPQPQPQHYHHHHHQQHHYYHQIHQIHQSKVRQPLVTAVSDGARCLIGQSSRYSSQPEHHRGSGGSPSRRHGGGGGAYWSGESAESNLKKMGAEGCSRWSVGVDYRER